MLVTCLDDRKAEINEVFILPLRDSKNNGDLTTVNIYYKSLSEKTNRIANSSLICKKKKRNQVDLTQCNQSENAEKVYFTDRTRSGRIYSSHVRNWGTVNRRIKTVLLG